MNTIVPVGFEHVGCVMLAVVGTEGGAGEIRLTVETAAVMQELSVVLLTVNVYICGVSPGNVGLD